MRPTSDAGSRERPSVSATDRQEEAGERGRSPAEWTTLAIGVLLILGLVALVTYVSVTGGDDPPIVEARPLDGEIRHEGEVYLLPVEATNRGGRTAEEVLIKAELVVIDGTTEESEFTIDFLAGGETAEGTVVFATDPLSGDLLIDVASFR